MDPQKAVFRLLKFREYSEKEIHDKLKKKNFPPDILDRTIDYFKGLGLINDRLFAQKWIRARLAKPFGPNRIQFELKAKGISEEIIKKELPDALSQFPEEEIVLKLAKERAAKYQNIDQDKLKQRVYGYLARRGFRREMILEAIERLNKQ